MGSAALLGTLELRDDLDGDSFGGGRRRDGALLEWIVVILSSLSRSHTINCVAPSHEIRTADNCCPGSVGSTDTLPSFNDFVVVGAFVMLHDATPIQFVDRT